jgi:hypothetical protein
VAPLLLLTLAAPPAEWTFRDDAEYGGRSVLTFRTVELVDTPPRPLHPDDKPPAGARFGVLPLGPGGKHRLAVVWHVATGALWVDADRDGRFAPAERRTLDGTLAVKAAIPYGDDGTHERTLLIRKRGDGLAYSVRGYVTGSLVLGGESYPAMLTDGDADGCFDGAASDRLWIDLNRDGKFDPLTEQFPLGRPVAVGPTGYLVRPDALGRRVAARERSTDTGTVTAKVTRLPGAKVVGMTAQFVSEFGELVSVTAADKPQTVPVGRYRVESLGLKLEDADGRVWEYRFTGDRRTAATVAKGEAVTADLTAGLKVVVAVDSAVAVPGREVEVTADVVTAGGLSMSLCQVYEKYADLGRGCEAVIQLSAPGSEVLAEARSGFA